LGLFPALPGQIQRYPVFYHSKEKQPLPSSQHDPINISPQSANNHSLKIYPLLSPSKVKGARLFLLGMEKIINSLGQF
jgi:hypothetical protein